MYSSYVCVFLLLAEWESFTGLHPFIHLVGKRHSESSFAHECEPSRLLDLEYSVPVIRPPHAQLPWNMLIKYYQYFYFHNYWLWVTFFANITNLTCRH